MTLRGSLRALGLADVLQLVGSQNKTGILRVWREVEEIQLIFKEGAMIGSRRLYQQKEETLAYRLGRRLLLAELLTEELLTLVLADADPLSMLKKLSGLQESQWQQCIRLESTELAYYMMAWQNGNYTFDVGVIEMSIAFMPHALIRAETLLMDVFRQADAWPRLIRLLPSFDSLIVPIANLATQLKQLQKPQEIDLDAIFSEFASTDSNRSSHTRQEVDPVILALRQIAEPEQKIYQLLGAEGSTLQRLLDLSLLGRFVIYDAIATLQVAGLVKITTGGATAIDPEKDLLTTLKKDKAVVDAVETALPQQASKNVAISPGRYAVFAALFYALGCLLLFISALYNSQGLLAVSPYKTGLCHYAQMIESEQQWQDALKVFYLLYGRFPKDLSELSAKNLLPDLNSLQWPEPLQQRWLERLLRRDGS